MNNEVRRKLQEVVFHRVKMWDAAREAELMLEESHQVKTAAEELDFLASACDTAEDAFKFEAADLKTILE